MLDLPVGGERGVVALYRTDGPFVHSVSLFSSVDTVQAGESFVVEVSGKLAGRPDQATGQLPLSFTHTGSVLCNNRYS